MLPIRQVGPTKTVTAGSTSSIDYPSAAVLLTHATAGSGSSYFSALITGQAAPASGLGVPVNPGDKLIVALPTDATLYAVQGSDLMVTPVEILRSA